MFENCQSPDNHWFEKRELLSVVLGAHFDSCHAKTPPPSPWSGVIIMSLLRQDWFNRPPYPHDIQLWRTNLDFYDKTTNSGYMVVNKTGFGDDFQMG